MSGNDAEEGERRQKKLQAVNQISEQRVAKNAPRSCGELQVKGLGLVTTRRPVNITQGLFIVNMKTLLKAALKLCVINNQQDNLKMTSSESHALNS